MASGASATSGAGLKWLWSADTWPVRLRAAWSPAAAVRAVRAAVVMAGLFAIADQVIGNLQVATFAAFGSFATLVLVSFGGSTRDKLIAHAGLAVAGSVLVIIGTSVASSAALAAIVTLPVTFLVFFARAAGGNAASGITGALLAYVLPAASPGTVAMIPDRLAGWWLASVAGTIAIVAFPAPAAVDELRAGVARLARCVADEIEALLRGIADEAHLEAAIAAKHDLLTQFNATPYRPTGLATADQAMANAVELVEWLTSLVADAVREQGEGSRAPPAARELLEATAAALRESAALFAGSRSWPDLDRVDRLRKAEIARLTGRSSESPDLGEQAKLSFHAQAIAVATLAFGADAVVATRLAGADWIIDARTSWFGDSAWGTPVEHIATSAASRYIGAVLRHASLRSTVFINAARGSLALAAAVAVADVGSLQHGFWVVLAALSVLRTNAASTGSTAVRALLGTGVGLVIGAALLLLIGTGSGALWGALPIAVLLAAYAPGTFSFAVGQAAFTVTVAVLFNLLVPTGWKVGVVRIEDVALGCVVSLVVGSLFWPRGMAAVVGDDLADAYRAGAAYLSHAMGWICGRRSDAPDEAMTAVSAGLRLDEALRGFIAEQGTKHLSQVEIWRLVGGALRLRLTAHGIARLPPHAGDPAAADLTEHADALQDFYTRLSAQLGRPRGQRTDPVLVPSVLRDSIPSAASARVIWLGEHLDHLQEHLHELVQPAARVAEIRRRPWWR